MLKDLRQLWQSLPHKAEFFVLLAAWTALFHYVGNTSLGYIDTPSVFSWLNRVYDTAEKFDNDDAFGRFVPVLVLVLAMVRSRELLAAKTREWAPGLAILAAAILLHAAGFRVQQPRISIAAYLLGGYGIMGLFWGPDWLRTSFFPYFLLAFSIPVSAYLDPLTNGLREVAAAASVGVCRDLFSMKLVRHGTEVWFPGTPTQPAFQFEVAAACSGIRSATVILMLTIAFGWLNFTSSWRRAVLVAASIPLALLGNVARLIFTFCVAEALDQKAGSAVETKTGAITFLVALCGVFAIGRLLRERRPGDDDDAAPDDPDTAPQSP
jgi:exosortase